MIKHIETDNPPLSTAIFTTVTGNNNVFLITDCCTLAF